VGRAVQKLRAVHHAVAAVHRMGGFEMRQATCRDMTTHDDDAPPRHKRVILCDVLARRSGGRPRRRAATGSRARSPSGSSSRTRRRAARSSAAPRATRSASRQGARTAAATRRPTCNDSACSFGRRFESDLFETRQKDSRDWKAPASILFKKLKAVETVAVATVTLDKGKDAFEQHRAEPPLTRRVSGYEREVSGRDESPVLERCSTAGSGSAGGSGTFFNWEAPAEIPRSPAQPQFGRRS